MTAPAGFHAPHPALSADRPELGFVDHKPRYTRAQAVTEAARCLYCHDAPCIQACPTAIDIPEFIRRIATDNVRGAARVIFDANILGTSCARVCPVEVLCVGSCVYNHEDVPPIQIGRLQRYATDRALEAGWTFEKPGPDSGRSVALVGAGPASLACAHELRRAGHRATIYERHNLPGGLNVTGVAPYKMKADAGLAEFEWITSSMGVEVRTGVEVGKDPSWATLLHSHDAVFLGMGLGPDSALSVPGEDLDGVWGGVAVIERWKNGQAPDLTPVRTAIVVGGGNTSLDVVRELRVLGVPRVLLVYRRGEAQMPGYVHEWDLARTEGVDALFHRTPVAFHGAGGKVTAVELAEVEVGPAGALTVRKDRTERVSAELVIVATGQGRLTEQLAAVPQLAIERGRLVVDAEGRTGNPKVFAGGDLANGGKEVVNAAAEGKRAARAIHAFLTA